MNLSVNGQSKVPPGFRFHPTEEELLQYYLKKKVALEKIDLDVIREVDLNKLEPWDIQEKCRIGSGPQNDWYFFSHKDKKYPTGTRTNRATTAGFWKATGRDKMIYGGNKRIGMRKTLVFYKGRAPHGEKSDWIMHEYRLEDCTTNPLQDNLSNVSTRQDNCMTEEGWVICRVFRKKNYQKAIDDESPTNKRSITTDSQSHQLYNFSSKKVLDHIFSCMGKTTTAFQHGINNNNYDPSPTTCSSSTSTSTTTNIFHTTDNYNNDHNNPIKRASDDDHRQLLLSDCLAEADDHHHQYELPMLVCSNSPSFDHHHHDDDSIMNSICFDEQRMDDVVSNGKPRLSDWMTLDRLIASQLNGQDQDLMYN